MRVGPKIKEESASMKKLGFVNPVLMSCLLAVSAAAQDSYTVPEDLRPVSDWAEGFTAEEAEAFR